MPGIGVIRCQQTGDMCAGATGFTMAAQGKGVFEGLDGVEFAGFVNRGGCPGKRTVARATMLVDHGAGRLFPASCIRPGRPVRIPCPHVEAHEPGLRPRRGPGAAGGPDAFLRSAPARL